jgi:ADP-ribose pyrophosphatase YjhB (NUDIX family)
MFEKEIVKHTIDRHILGVLLGREFARFSDMRPPRVDTNLYSYHLKTMLADGWLKKTDSGYTLTAKGLAYVDRVSASTVSVRRQPKIITMLLVQNSDGEVLMMKRQKQPYIDTWTLPYGKLHIDDESIIAAAKREAQEKLNYIPSTSRHAGDCYIRVYEDSEILTSTLAHIVRFETDNIIETETLKWFSPLRVTKLRTAPAVNEIIARSFFGDQFFFEEFTTTA